MFDGKKYITCGIKENIDVKLQYVMWKLIDELKEKDNFKVDYLQIFLLKPFDTNAISILHKQEVPEYSHEYIMQGINLFSLRKVYVIDDGEYAIMLLAEEY